MTTNKSIHIHFIPRLLMMVPAICSMAFAACSDLAGTRTASDRKLAKCCGRAATNRRQSNYRPENL